MSPGYLGLHRGSSGVSNSSNCKHYTLINLSTIHFTEVPSLPLNFGSLYGWTVHDQLVSADVWEW